MLCTDFGYPGEQVDVQAALFLPERYHCRAMPPMRRSAENEAHIELPIAQETTGGAEQNQA